MGYLHFTVDSALLGELGEKLVASVHIALVELVKNSYDADAKTVHVKIIPRKKKGPMLFIKDDGIGMTYEEVKRYWMRIATTNKTINEQSKIYGRPRTGSKGIGRFSCRRLGDYLRLITTARIGAQKYQTTDVEFPWRNFKPGTDVTSINCKGIIRMNRNEKQGTILIIKNRNVDEWSYRGYSYLTRQLAVLAANRGAKRAGYKADPGFGITLNAPEFENADVTDIRQKLMNAGWGTLCASIDSRGHAMYELNAMEIGYKKITSIRKYKHLRGVTLKLAIMVDNRKQMRDTSVLSIGTLQDILKDWGGVQVKYNNFRVYPYGDDDWLEIDKDRGLRKGAIEGELIAFADTLKGVDPMRAKLSMLSMKSYVGSVDINSRSTGFEMKVNREGFLENQSLSELREFVRFAIDWSTIYRDYFIRKRLQGSAEIARMELQEVMEMKVEPEKVVQKAVEYIRKEAKNVLTLLPLKERLQIEKGITKATDAIISEERFNKEELKHLRLIASTSTLLLIFNHEVRSFLVELETYNSSLYNLERNVTARERETIQSIRRNLVNTKNRFKELMDMTALIAIDSRNASETELALYEKLNIAVECYRLIISRYNIEIQFDKVPKNLKVCPMLEAELYSILLNILSNSIKSVIAGGSIRKIEVEAFKENNKNYVSFRDTGIGVELATSSELFIPFIADPKHIMYTKLVKSLNPEDKYIIGSGSGLGLSIVKQIVQNKKGTIKFIKPQEGWKSELQIIIP